MKKIVFLSLIIIVGVIYLNYNPIEINKKDNLVKNNEVSAVFVSYIDYASLKGKDKIEQEKVINEMINNIDYFGFNTIILQVRPFGDAIYNSLYFPSSSKVVKNEGDSLELDILQYFIEQSKKKNIDIYSWINPYRIRNVSNTDDMSKKSIYYSWIDSDKIYIGDDGIFFNPSSDEVLDLILDGVREIAENYDVKGILYDDYFYPNDKIDLNNYKNDKSDLSIENYRISIINNLLKESYNTIKEVNKNILFGISPSGNIENNLNNEYLDIQNILKDNYLDFIMPQLYYGFNNQNKPYIETLDKWNQLNVNNIDLYVALSLYKAGTLDTYAGNGEKEWMDNTDVVKKQILISRTKNNYKGYGVFRYEYLFEIFDNDFLLKEIENLRDIINVK